MNQTLWKFAALIVLASSMTGCGGSGVVKPTDEQNAFASIEGLGDMAGDDETFAMAFVSGAVPDNREEYAQRGYQVEGEPVYSGDSVSVPVKIFGGVYATGAGDGRSNKTSTASETTQTWTLQKENDQWKIKEAPLG